MVRLYCRQVLRDSLNDNLVKVIKGVRFRAETHPRSDFVVQLFVDSDLTSGGFYDKGVALVAADYAVRQSRSCDQKK